MARDLRTEVESDQFLLFTNNLLSLPREARKIFRAIDSDASHVVDAFDRSARLYQVAKVVETVLPSVALAYRVAAVEALSKADLQTKGFSDFMRKNVRSVPDLNPLLEYLYGTIRSAHFHSGGFPLGEFDLSFRHPWTAMDSASLDLRNLEWISSKITREAIVNWAVDQLPDEKASTTTPLA